MQKYENPKDYENDLKKEIKRFAKIDDWTAENLLQLKSVITHVNAHVSYLMGLKFLDTFDLPKENFNYKDMYTNGFDIEIEKDGELYVAEIKGNVPCGKNGSYGANQKTGIKNDLKYLKEGKRTASEASEKIKNGEAYRAMVLLEKNREAFKNSFNEQEYIIIEENQENKTLEKSRINIVFVTI